MADTVNNQRSQTPRMDLGKLSPSAQKQMIEVYCRSYHQQKERLHKLSKQRGNHYGLTHAQRDVKHYQRIYRDALLQIDKAVLDDHRQWKKQQGFT